MRLISLQNRYKSSTFENMVRSGFMKQFLQLYLKGAKVFGILKI